MTIFALLKRKFEYLGLAERMDKKIIESSLREYMALPDVEWLKDFFCYETGGYVATHVLKAKDDSRPGIIAEKKACLELAKTGKHILRLPDNVLKLIDEIMIMGKKYRELLKYKNGQQKPRGYPDAYFDGMTWDFKTSTYNNEDSLRQAIKEGRKADNLIFITNEPKHVVKIEIAIERESGRRLGNKTWIELPDVYYLSENQLFALFEKHKKRQI